MMLALAMMDNRKGHNTCLRSCCPTDCGLHQSDYDEVQAYHEGINYGQPHSHDLFRAVVNRSAGEYTQRVLSSLTTRCPFACLLELPDEPTSKPFRSYGPCLIVSFNSDCCIGVALGVVEDLHLLCEVYKSGCLALALAFFCRAGSILAIGR